MVQEKNKKEQQSNCRRSWNERRNQKQGRNVNPSKPGAVSSVVGTPDAAVNSKSTTRSWNEREHKKRADNLKQCNDNDDDNDQIDQIVEKNLTNSPRKKNPEKKKKKKKHKKKKNPPLNHPISFNDDRTAVTATTVVSSPSPPDIITATPATILTPTRRDNIEAGGDLLADDNGNLIDGNKCGAIIDATISVVTAQVVDEEKEIELVERIQRLEEAPKPEIVSAVRISHNTSKHGCLKKKSNLIILTGMGVLLVVTMVIVLSLVLGNETPPSPITYTDYDEAYIHKSCLESKGLKPKFYTNHYFQKTTVTDFSGGLGDGWYCDDHQVVSSTTSFDLAHIHSDCKVGVTYDHNTEKWYCNNDMPSS